MFTSGSKTCRKSECAFFMRSRDRCGKLSNMTSGFPLEVNGLRFQGPEGLYQAMKFPHDPAQQARISGQRSGMDAQREAYRRGSFRTGRDEVRVDRTACTLAAKPAQRPETFGRELLQAGELPVVEMSSRGGFWGAKPGRDGTELVGTNMPGQLLTALREELRRQEGDAGRAVEEYLDANVRLERLVVNGQLVG